VGITLDACCSTTRTRTGRLHEFYEICIDNGSQVNIIDPRLLRDLRTTCKTYHSMNGLAETSRVGRLEGFFDCMACEECPTSILSLTDVEDIYPVTFVQGESITIHMDHRDVVFARRDKLYVAGFSVWVVDSDDRVQEMNEGLNLMTAAERESLYTRREVRKALEAAEFLRALGYPSEHEAVKLVRSGNVRNIPYSVDDAGRFYDIYGGQVAAIRGQTTKRHVKLSAMADSTARMQITEQELAADVMHIADQNFLISMRSPLELVLACHLKSCLPSQESEQKRCRYRGAEAHQHPSQQRV